MFNDINRIENRIRNLERGKGASSDDGYTEIYLDFNSAGEHDENEIMLLCRIPPKRYWRGTR